MPTPVRVFFAVVPWLALLGVLAIGVPLFLAMPLWVDTTYHDLSARNILRGGVHYRDVFETNLPGMVWLHAVVRPIVGWTSEAIRAVDLGVLTTGIVLLIAYLRRDRLSVNSCVWFAMAAYLFYLFETEFIHCQRDGWMLLPTIVAFCLRSRQADRLLERSQGTVYWSAALEGMCWALAVWIKPHATIPALFVWGASLPRLFGLNKRKTLFDFLGLLTGGIVIGGLGTAWLVLTHTWAPMWDVLLNWNPEYYKWTPAEMDSRLSSVIMYFAPWSLIHYLALPTAFYALVRARTWQAWPDRAIAPRAVHQALLAALYLGWLAEASLIQKTFHYAHAPVIFLALALLAGERVPVGPILLGWCLLGGVLNHYKAATPELRWLNDFKEAKPNTFKQVVPRHRLINDDWRSVWRQCVRGEYTPELKDHLSFYRGIHCAPNWTELDETRQFLATLNLKDGELVCWDDTTHPLYLDLNLRPTIRFLHVNTSLEFRGKRPTIRGELIATGHKYVVSDAAVVQFLYEPFDDDGRSDDPLRLPSNFPCACRGIYPWDQPVIKKFGRYWIHRIENPIGDIRVPYPVVFDKP
jgi:hypothetical protein